jgi:hypothetical protein
VVEERERRQWDRLQIILPMFVRGTDSSDEEFVEMASALEVSAGGALIALARQLVVGSFVAIDIPYAPVLGCRVTQNPAKHLRAEIIRADPADGCYLFALKWSTGIAAPRRTDRAA